jgi:hypothetical protein
VKVNDQFTIQNGAGPSDIHEDPSENSMLALLLKSCAIQVKIHSLIRQQLRVSPLLDDLSIVDHDDLIGIRDR